MGGGGKISNYYNYFYSSKLVMIVVRAMPFLAARTINAGTPPRTVGRIVTTSLRPQISSGNLLFHYNVIINFIYIFFYCSNGNWQYLAIVVVIA